MAKVKVSEVKIKVERFREEFGDVESLAVSIQRYGLFHPIVVDKELNLIAGERRLKAHQMLGLDEIEVKYIGDIDDLGKREIEIEENLKRKDFTWQEEVRAKGEVMRIKKELYGAAVKGHGGGFGLKELGASLGESTSLVAKDLRLAEAFEEYPELAKEKTKDAAFKKLQRIRERGIIDELSGRVQVQIDTKCIINGNSCSELAKLASNSVDLVCTDPPFAIGLDSDIKSSEHWAKKVYDDEYQHVLDTIDIVAGECYRVLKDDRHMYMFFGVQHYEWVFNMLVRKGFNVGVVPLVWAKTGGGGAGGSEFAYASNYEVCFLCMKGRRPLNKLGQPNVLEYPRVAPQRKVHPTEKPLPLLRYLVGQSSEKGELVLDPFAGSGSTILAALQLKRNALGIELDKEYYDKIVLRIEELKQMGEKKVTEEEIV